MKKIINLMENLGEVYDNMDIILQMLYNTSIVM
jgi:hypothetical protein